MVANGFTDLLIDNKEKKWIIIDPDWFHSKQQPSQAKFTLLICILMRQLKVCLTENNK